MQTISSQVAHTTAKINPSLMIESEPEALQPIPTALLRSAEASGRTHLLVRRRRRSQRRSAH